MKQSIAIVRPVLVGGELTFKTITFTIKEVYRSTGDDDTALSEIWFYSKGKKVDAGIVK